MKKLIITFISILYAITTYNQVPEKINYQAVVRNNNGDLIRNSTVRFRISILEGASNGLSVYTETHSSTTNTQGLVNLKIGGGSGSGNFANIDWSGSIFFLKVEMDPAGGTAYALYSTSQLLSVPYSLFSKNSAMLDGHTAAYYQNATNINSGTLSYDRFNAYNDLIDAGRLDNNSGSDLLTRTQLDTMYDVNVAFYAYNSSTDNITNSDRNPVEFNKERFDIGNNYNSTTDLFTAPYKGIYQFNNQVVVDEINSFIKVSVWLHVNTEIRQCLNIHQISSANDYEELNSSVTVYLDAGDKVGLSINSSDASYSICGSSGNMTFFSGYLVLRIP